MTKKIFQNTQKFSLILCLGLLIGSCSEDGLNEHVDAEMSPKSPSIISIDTKKGTGSDADTISAPWFLASFYIKNKHRNWTLVIPALQFEYRGLKGGKVFEGTGVLNADDICDQDGAIRNVYAQIGPDSDFNGDPDCDFTNTGLELVYLHGLPGATDKVTNFQIKVTFEGYFVDQTSLTEPIKGRVQLIRYYMTH